MEIPSFFKLKQPCLNKILLWCSIFSVLITHQKKRNEIPEVFLNIRQNVCVEYSVRTNKNTLLTIQLWIDVTSLVISGTKSTQWATPEIITPTKTDHWNENGTKGATKFKILLYNMFCHWVIFRLSCLRDLITRRFGIVLVLTN